MERPKRTIGEDDVLHHMEVEPGIYVVGSFEQRVTLYSQQVRALNLVYALHRRERLPKGGAIAVVGGGAAGLTAAAGAARLGYEVTLLEKGDVLLPLLRGNHTRWLHPHLYEWPAEGAERVDAGLPVLDWTAGLADEVGTQLDAAWNALPEPERKRVTVHTGVSSVDPGAGQISWNAGGFHSEPFAAVVFTVGFGLEQPIKDVPWLSYWQNDALHQPSLKGRARHLISGCGDGGLIDLLRVRLRGFEHEDVTGLLALVPDAAKKELLAIDQDARRSPNPAAVLHKRYRALELPDLDTALKNRLRDDTEAVLNGRTLPLTLGASILNRVLVSRLLRLGVTYRQGEPVCRPINGGYEVTFATGPAERFDHVTGRHGTGPKALESFPDVWKKCDAMRTRNALDQTRWPIYGDAFGPVPAPRESAARPAKSAVTKGAPFLGVRSDSLRDGFKGRDKDLEALRGALAGGSVALRGVPGHVYARGGGGLGKSRLAIEHAWRCRDDYPGGVFFAVVASRAPMAVLADFGRMLFAGEDLTRDDDAAHRFVTWLVDPGPGRRLLVLDDVQGASQEEVTLRLRDRVEVRGTTMWPLSGLGHVAVLMTTRLREIPGARAFDVRALDEEGALALLVGKADRVRAALSPAEEAAARVVAVTMLGGHALALSLAGAYVRRAMMPFVEYRKALAAGVTRKLEEAAKHVGYEIEGHDASIAATYALSREQLAAADPGDALAWRILKVAAWLAPNVAIDRGLLGRLLGREGAAADAEAVGFAGTRLMDLALLDAAPDGGDVGDVAIHPLVADYTKTVLDAAERVRVREAVLGAVGGLFPYVSYEYWRIMQPGGSLGWEWLSPAREAHASALWEEIEPVASLERANLGGKLGDLHYERGDAERALVAYRASSTVAEHMIGRNPDDMEGRRHLAPCHDRIGDVLRSQGNTAGALDSYRAGLDIAERLAEHDPEAAEQQRNLSVSHNKIGDALLVDGDKAGALKSYRKSLAIRERLAGKDPENTLWQRDLSVSHNRIGDALRSQGDMAGARTSYRASLAIAERLARLEPGNAGWQRDLSFSHNRIGDALHSQGDMAGALASYRESLAIRERLAQQDPTNIEWQTDLALSSYNVGRTLLDATPADRAEERRLLERACHILRTLAAASRLTHAQQHEWLPGFEAALKALPRNATHPRRTRA